MNTKLTAAVVGGGQGGKLSLAALHDSENYHLVAVADLRPEARQALAQEFPGLKTFATVEEMLTEAPTDVVCVSTYPPSHEPIVQLALKQPGLKGLLVEKPLGDTAGAGRRIVESIRARGLPMVVPHGLRTRAVPGAVLARIAAGEIGQVRVIEMQCDKWDIINAGIHWFDFCLAVTNNTPIASVLCAADTSTRTFRDGMQVETDAVTYVVNHDGVRFVLQTGDYTKLGNGGDDATQFRIVGDLGTIEFLAWKSTYRLCNGAHPKGEIFSPEEFAIAGHQRHLDNLAEHIFSGRPDYSVAESSLAALEICEAAFVSARNRCRVTFPYSEFVVPNDTNWLPGQPYSGSGGGRNGRTLPQ